MRLLPSQAQAVHFTHPVTHSLARPHSTTASSTPRVCRATRTREQATRTPQQRPCSPRVPSTPGMLTFRAPRRAEAGNVAMSSETGQLLSPSCPDASLWAAVATGHCGLHLGAPKGRGAMEQLTGHPPWPACGRGLGDVCCIWTGRCVLQGRSNINSR